MERVVWEGADAVVPEDPGTLSSHPTKENMGSSLQQGGLALPQRPPHLPTQIATPRSRPLPWRSDDDLRTDEAVGYNPSK